VQQAVADMSGLLCSAGFCCLGNFPRWHMCRCAFCSTACTAKAGRRPADVFDFQRPASGTQHHTEALQMLHCSMQWDPSSTKHTAQAVASSPAKAKDARLSEHGLVPLPCSSSSRSKFVFACCSASMCSLQHTLQCIENL
jgi:hypothetical protein